MKILGGVKIIVHHMKILGGVKIIVHHMKILGGVKMIVYHRKILGVGKINENKYFFEKNVLKLEFGPLGPKKL